MAVICMDFCSRSLMMNTLVTMIVPDSRRIGDTSLSNWRVMYLLHGLSGDATDWIRLSNVERYALERGFVVVMPSGGRSMYTNGLNGQNHMTFITDELPSYLHGLFGLSTDRDMNCIAGLSMGGYGACRAALSNPHRYFSWGSFSGLLDIRPLVSRMDPETAEQFPFFLEALKDIDNTRLNPVNLIDPKAQRHLRGFAACGLSDDLLGCTKGFERADSGRLLVKYVYEEGSHEWGFWDRMILAYLDSMDV